MRGIMGKALSFFLPLLLAIVVTGCITKAKANAQARAAFLAGQEQALRRVQQARDVTVTVVGQVRNPVVQWTSDLTVAKAIVAAGYYGAADPAEIVILRNDEELRVDPKQLLAGEDVPLESGDVLRIK
jgi:protein involved in polysaccharide export with SLBB domain